MVRSTASWFLVFLLALPLAAAGQQAVIRDAMSAAPADISADAKVMDWQGNTLRGGSNGWTCFPDMPDTPGRDPMCLDDPWLAWADAWMNRTEPEIDRIGFGYMLQGGTAGSNVDPYAEGPTPGNEWSETELPHVMMLLPDPDMLAGLPTDPSAGGPWVMWRGTPYVHVMIPTPRLQEAGGVVVFSQNKCAGDALGELGRVTDERFGPVLDELVAEGALTGWGVLTHLWGDEWNWNIWYSAESQAAFVEAWSDAMGRMSQRHPGWFAEIAPLCSEHKDNIYRVRN